MYTIQYVDTVTRKSAMETLETRNSASLIQRVAHFEHEILAIYEQGTPVTKRTRTQLMNAARGNVVRLSEAAKIFITEGIRATTPA